jgi:CBS domain-containing protein
VTKSIRDLMHPGVITCRPDATLGQVAVMLNQHHVHALIVADRDGRPLGVISDFDLLAGEWLSADPESLETMRTMTAGELMSTPVDTIEANAPVSEAARRMREEGIHRLLAIDGGQPVGVVSISDFVASLAETAPVRRETVADVMSDAMLVCRDKTPITAAARTMTQAGWRSVLVVDATGRPLGVVSGPDLVAFCEKEKEECTDATVSEVMHPPLKIHMSASLREAADKMIKHHHHRLVVVDPDAPETMPLGIISSFDIIAEMAHPASVWQLQ